MRKGMAQLQTKHYPKADIVFASPMKRCIMTAEAIYPNQEMILCEGFKEMDFGDFEGKSYEELKDNPDYINWIESGGEIAFPNGERKKISYAVVKMHFGRVFSMYGKAVKRWKQQRLSYMVERLWRSWKNMGHQREIITGGGFKMENLSNYILN